MKPISIVICAKNELNNLKTNLPKVLNQVHPNFEVIVIDDGSMDGSPEFLKTLEDHHPNFFSFRIEPNEKLHPGKKHALSYGVSLAKHDLIVVTDADCHPLSQNWIKTLSEPLHREADIVLGISPFVSKPGFSNSFFKMEALSVALQYINFTLSGVPFMGVGRNMAYKKSVFESYDIKKHWDLTSGDDDLFVSDIASEHKVELVTHQDAFTISDAPTDFKTWFHQKLRHYTTGYHYELIQKIWLGYYWLSSLFLYLLLFYVSFLLLLKVSINPVYIALFFGTVALRWIITILSVKKLGEKTLNWNIPCLDFLYILSVWLVSPLSRVLKYKWK